MSDDFLFAEEETEVQLEEQATWKILIVDDEPEMHSITRLALSDFMFQDKRLEFLSAYSGDEARKMIVAHPDTAVVLLDVVMESDDAGLRVADFIRNEAQNTFCRIILRTGQPGQAPEREVIVNYEINDYKSKTELTAQKLFTVVLSALRSYRDILAIDNNRQGLEKVIQASANLLTLTSLEKFVEGLVQQLSSLLRGDESAYMVSSAVCGPVPIESKSRDALYVFCGQGDYQNKDGLPISQVLDPQIVEVCQNALNEQSIYYGEDFLVAYCSSKANLGSIFYVSGLPKRLTDAQQNLVELFTKNVQIAFENILFTRDIEETQREIIGRISEAAENSVSQSINHTRRLARYAELMGRLLRLAEQDIETLKMAVPLHDVGNIAVDSSILSTPGPLSAEQKVIMQTHPEVGHSFLQGSHKPMIKAAATIALQHHEHWDGCGYPNGISGESIHLYARITALIDVYDALRNERTYRPAFDAEQAKAMLAERAGKQFDAKLVALLVANYQKFEAILSELPDNRS